MAQITADNRFLNFKSTGVQGPYYGLRIMERHSETTGGLTIPVPKWKILHKKISQTGRFRLLGTILRVYKAA
jgi:hypothetical protein